jgi:hypothetical protein
MSMFLEGIASKDEVEIIIPESKAAKRRPSAVCLCCERADQPMDDDGCGICDACLGLPARIVDNAGGLEFPSALPHLLITARNR